MVMIWIPYESGFIFCLENLTIMVMVLTCSTFHDIFNQKCQFLMDGNSIKWTILTEMKSHSNNFGWATAKNKKKYENCFLHWIHFNYWSFGQLKFVSRISRKVYCNYYSRFMYLRPINIWPLWYSLCII